MIRPMDASEADAVRTLVRGAHRRWIKRLGGEPSPMRDDDARRITDGQAWVLEDEGELVGVVVLKDEPGALLIPNIVGCGGVSVTDAGRSGWLRWGMVAAEHHELRRGGEMTWWNRINGEA